MRRRIALIPTILLLATTTAAFADVSPLKDPVTGRTFALITDRGIRVNPAGQPGAHAQALAPAAALSASDAFLRANREAVGWSNPGVTLAAAPLAANDLGQSHIRYYQYYRGLPVFGGEVITHVGPDGEVYYATTKLAQAFPDRITPGLTREMAKNAASRQAEKDSREPAIMVPGEPKLLLLPLGLIQNTASSEATLAWEVSVHDDQGGDLVDQTYYVDASTGDPLLTLSNRQYLDRRVYDCATPDNNCDLDVYDPATNYTYGRSEGMPPRGPSPTPGYTGSTDVDSLYTLLGAMHNFVSTSFGINGANDLGGTGVTPAGQTLGYVHVDNQSVICVAGVRAQIVLATGELDFCRGYVVTDIVGHEYSHAVLYHSFKDTNGLSVGPVYYGQAGALNEAFADFTGEAFQNARAGSNDWLHGDGSISGPSRDLANPSTIQYASNSPYPKNYYSPTQYCTQSSDNNGVHVNSTIISHAFYRMAVGGDEIGCDITPIGIEAAKQVFYRAWRYYFSRTETFAQAFYGIQQACADLYPTATCDQVRKALEASEINQPGYCSGQPEPGPTCGIRHVTNAFTAKLKGGVVTDAILFAPGEHLMVHGMGNDPNRHIRLFLKVRPLNPQANYWDLSLGTYTQVVSTTTGPNGEFSITFPNALTQFSPTRPDDEIYVDGNNDGLWEPWADTVLPFSIHVPVDGDGLCYSGESYATSENCQSSPLDCACTGGATCQLNGSGQYVCASASGVDGVPLPSRVALAIVGANPARGAVQMAVALPRAAAVDVTVYGVQGRVVRRLRSQEAMPAGISAVSWDGRDDGGALLAGGVYFVRMRVNDETYRQTVVLLR